MAFLHLLAAHPSLFLPLLRQIIKEEVHQHGVHFGFRVCFYDLPSHQFDRPDATAAQLHFPAVPRRNGLTVFDRVEQRRTVADDAEGGKDLWDAVVCAIDQYVKTSEYGVSIPANMVKWSMS